MRELFAVLLKGSLFFCASEALWLQKFLIVICRILDFGIIFLSKFWKDGVPLLQSMKTYMPLFLGEVFKELGTLWAFPGEP